MGYDVSLLYQASLDRIISLCSALRFGSRLSVFGIMRFGTTMTVLDMVDLGTSVSMGAFFRCGSLVCVVDILQVWFAGMCCR